MRNGKGTGPGEDRGNAILSTLPLSDITAVELPFEAQRRVAVAARLAGTTFAGESWHLQVASAHLDVRSSWPRLLASAGAGRRRQARWLVDALDLSRPTVLGGDLNTWAPRTVETALPFLRERFPCTPVTRRQATFTVGPFYRPQLDHLFFRLHGRHAVAPPRPAPSRYGSDHYPLVAAIRFV
jgi:endonuclease/exonuclease/phosphatase family metal-dependent hydrolase